MSKALVHAQSSVKKHGGIVEDYLPIHDLMDCSKSVIADNRHRALTHNHWFIQNIVERVLGNYITNSDGKAVSVRQIAEEHCLEDYNCKFIPSAQDFLERIEYAGWMDNGMSNDCPSSVKRVHEYRKNKRQRVLDNLAKQEVKEILEGHETDYVKNPQPYNPNVPAYFD